MNALRFGQKIWADVVLYGLAGPITGLAYDDENLIAQHRYRKQSPEWLYLELTADNWREIGAGAYQLRLGPYDASWDATYLYYRVVYLGEPGVDVTCTGAIAHAPAVEPLTGYELAALIVEYLSGVIADVDDWHSGYIREHVPHKRLPAVDVAVTGWAAEDASGYRRWTGDLSIRVAAADAKRTPAVEALGNLVSDIIELLGASDLAEIPVDAIRELRVEYGTEPEGQAVRTAKITGQLILEV